MLLFGAVIQQHNFETSGKDESGLGRSVSMVLRGLGGILTRFGCGYNPCASAKKAIHASYQQQRRHFITKEKDRTCSRKIFRDNLIKQRVTWKRNDDRLIICMDTNEDIYKKSIEKTLVSNKELCIGKAVGDFTGNKVGATFFRGKKQIDGV